MEKAVQQVREETRAEAKRRVLRNIGRYPPSVQRFLEEIADVILDEDLDLPEVIRKARVNPSSFYTRFCLAVGVYIPEFIDGIRGKFVVPLVDAGRDLWDVAEIVGLKDADEVSALYTRITESPPLGYEPQKFGFDDKQTVKRLADDQPTRNDLRAIRHFYRRHASRLGVGPLEEESPAVEPQKTAPKPRRRVGLRMDRLFDAAVDDVMEQLLELDLEDWEEEVRQIRCRTTAIFERLHQLARSEGRRDRRRGKEIARLAWVHVLENREDLGKDVFARASVRARAWYGNSQRLALDLPEAEATFEATLREMHEHGLGGSATEAEVLALFGSLRVTQRQDKEARQLLQRALKLFRKADDVEGQVRVLNQLVRAAFYRGALEEAWSDLKVAVRLLEGHKDAELRAGTLYNVANCQVRRGRIAEAEKALAELRRLRAAAPDPSREMLELWLRGDVENRKGDAAAAEQTYRQVLDGFDGLGESLDGARVRLDLALLLGRDEPCDEAVRLASEALPVFLAFELSGETESCLSALRRALNRRAVEASVLRRLRKALRADPLVDVACPRG